MTIGGSLFLIAVGAIPRFAVTAEFAGSTQTVGAIHRRRASSGSRPDSSSSRAVLPACRRSDLLSLKGDRSREEETGARPRQRRSATRPRTHCFRRRSRSSSGSGSNCAAALDGGFLPGTGPPRDPIVRFAGLVFIAGRRNAAGSPPGGGENETSSKRSITKTTSRRSAGRRPLTRVPRAGAASIASDPPSTVAGRSAMLSRPRPRAACGIERDRVAATLICTDASLWLKPTVADAFGPACLVALLQRFGAGEVHSRSLPPQADHRSPRALHGRRRAAAADRDSARSAVATPCRRSTSGPLAAVRTLSGRAPPPRRSFVSLPARAPCSFSRASSSWIRSAKRRCCALSCRCPRCP